MEKLKPARVYPPGRTLKNELRSLGLSQKSFAEIIERPPQFVSELINGKRELTADTASRLGAALGPSPGFWLRLEANYRLHIAEKVENQANIYKRIKSRSLDQVAETRTSYDEN